MSRRRCVWVVRDIAGQVAGDSPVLQQVDKASIIIASALSPQSSADLIDSFSASRLNRAVHIFNGLTLSPTDIITEHRVRV